jgi:HK97 gp10 family phage protein
MGAALTVKVEGLDSLFKTLTIKQRLGVTKLPKVLHKGALRIERDAKLNAPIDTGTLRASIHTTKVSQLTYIVSDGVNYGIFLEVGTKYITGVHFLQKAAKKNKKKIVQDIEKLYAK